MGKLTFDQLPEAIAEMLETVRRIEMKLEKQSAGNREDTDIMDIDQASKFLNLSKPTIYSKTSLGEIPYIKYGKKLRFQKQALIEMLLSKKVKTNNEIYEDAEGSFLANNQQKRKALRY